MADPLRVTRRRRSRSGAAFVEAVIMVPALLVVLFGVTYACISRVSVLVAMRTARACAMEYATSGCVTVPAACEDLVSTSREPPDAETLDGIEGAAADGLAAAAPILPVLGSLSSFPVLGDALATVFGERATANVERQHRTFRASDRTERTVTGTFTIACNVPAREAGDVADELFAVVTGDLF